MVDHITPKLERDVSDAPSVADAAAKRWADTLRALFDSKSRDITAYQELEIELGDFDEPVRFTLTRRQVCLAAQCVAFFANHCLPEDMAAMFHCDDGLQYLGGLPTMEEINALDKAMSGVASDVENDAKIEVEGAHQFWLDENARDAADEREDYRQWKGRAER